MIDKSVLTQKALYARTHRFLTNCYSFDALDSVNGFFECGESFAISSEDHGINRLYFFAKDKDEMGSLMGSVDKGVYFVEYMTKDPDELTIAGAAVIARMKRIVNKDCSTVLEDPVLEVYRDDTIGEYADVKDAREINKILWSTFQTEISHLLSDEEIEEIIKANKMIIHRGDQIDALLQVDVMPKKFYINQVINKADKSVIHAMLLSELAKYVQNSGKYMYSWVEENNIASMKFHQKYGMSHDGMWNLVYRLEI